MCRLIVLELPGEWRDVVEADSLGEEAIDLAIRIGSRLEAPEELEDETIAVDDRGIALLPRRAAWRQLVLGRSSYRRQRRARHSAHEAALGRHSGGRLDRAEQRHAGGIIAERVV